MLIIFNSNKALRFQVFMVVKITIVVFWVKTMCSNLVTNILEQHVASTFIAEASQAVMQVGYIGRVVNRKRKHEVLIGTTTTKGPAKRQGR
jgi:ABC-type amino acid transport system permease subunit